jgi:hypothetical protein
MKGVIAMKYERNLSTTTDVYAWFKGILERNNLTYIEADKILGTTRQTIYNWTSGKARLQKVQLAGIIHLLGDESDDIDKLCEFLGVS